MAANVEAMVREGENALKAGRKDEARALLMKAVELDQFNEDAWLWLSAVVETPEDQQTCLENVLAINPGNTRAREGLEYLEQQRGGGSARVPSAPPPASPPITPPPPPPASKDFSTSVEWAAPDSDMNAPAPSRKVPELSEEDYDDWVSTLNLPTSSKPPEPQPFLAEESITTDEIDEIDEEPFFDLPLAPPPAPEISVAPEPKPSKQKRKEKKTDPDFGEDVGKAAVPAPEPYEPLFPEIPDTVKATRLPGTTQRIPIVLILVLLALIALNIGAAVMLIQALLPS